LHGQAVYRELNKLKKEGFYPDIVYGHSGWGPTMFIKDVFPRSKLLCYFEWFYNADGSDVGFDPSEPLTPDDKLRIRIKNAPFSRISTVATRDYAQPFGKRINSLKNITTS